MLEVINLDFDYQYEPILKNVSFQLASGELLHLKGSNGAGKTTLLKLISGLHQPTFGQILFMGKSIGDNLQGYHNQLCFVGHKTGISPNLSLRENCLFDAQNQNGISNLQELASIFKLEHHIDSQCALLSAGQRRQVGLLRLWMTDAPLWLLDEPFIALDNLAQHTLMNHIQEHRKKGGAVLLTSHQNLDLGSDAYKEYHL